MLWIHFTGFPELFEFGEPVKQMHSSDPASFAEIGLCVYKFFSRDQFEQIGLGWEEGVGKYRQGIIIECPEEFVEILQESPLDENPWYDEYIIPVENFRHTRVVWPGPPDQAWFPEDVE